MQLMLVAFIRYSFDILIIAKDKILNIFMKLVSLYLQHGRFDMRSPVPRETRAGTALLSIQKDTQDSITISMVGK